MNVEWILGQALWNHKDLPNPKALKKYSVEFAIVDCDLTSLIGSRVAHQKALITVHDDNFITISPPSRQSEPQVKQITAEELVKQ